MQSLVLVFRALNIVSAGLVAGAQVFVMLALIPAMKGCRPRRVRGSIGTR